jgi:protein-disulfide isomerase
MYSSYYLYEQLGITATVVSYNMYIRRVYVNRFWIILSIVILGLIGIFIATGKDESKTNFTGDAKKVQSDDHVKFDNDHKVTLVEYGDFQCPSCGSYYPVLQQVAEKYKDQVNFVFRHFPLISIHPNAFAASRAAEAASNQGKFWEMHDKLFETQNSWGQTSANQQSLFEGYAEELGLDMAKFKKDYASEAVANRINRDVASAKQFDITGTPTFILNGEKITSPGDVTAFEKVLNEAIKKAGGTAPSEEEDSEPAAE